MISVLIPVYNTNPDFITQCFESIKKQTFDKFEVIVVDNGSDNKQTIDVLDKYKKESAFFVYNCGRVSARRNISYALNYGIEKCNFDLIARMDSDDIMLPERLEKQVKFMNENTDVDACGTQIRFLSSNRETNHKEIIGSEEYKKSRWFINHPTVVFRKEKVLEVGGYPELPEYCPEDLLLWAKMLKNGSKIRNIKEALVLYRLHQNNTYATDSKKTAWKASIHEWEKLLK